MTFQNLQLLRLEAGERPKFPNDPRLAQLIRGDLEKEMDRSGAWGRWQFKLLIVGAVAYVAWHVIEMLLRTPAT